MKTLPAWLLATALSFGAFFAFICMRVMGHIEAQSPLQAFYVDGFSGTFLIAGYFLALCALLTVLYASSSFVRSILERAWQRLEAYSEHRHAVLYGLFVFGIAALVLFLLNAPGILTGTFLIDDYEMYGIATSKTVWQLLWTPINDHVIFFFWLELKGLFALVGATPPFLNFPLFGAAIVTLGASGILLRQLRFHVGAYFALLAIFATTTIVSHQLYGFYAVAPYFQVLATLMLALVCFTHAKQHVRFSTLFFTLSILLIITSVLIESSGIWTPLALALFAIAYRISNLGDLRIAALREAVWKEKVVIILSLSIIALYVAYLVLIPHFSDASFYGPDHLPLSLHTIIELYKVVTAGVLLSFVAPRFGLIMSQPRFESLEPLWQVFMCALFLVPLLSYVWTYIGGSVRARVWSTYFAALALGTSLIVAIARPSPTAAAQYRDQNLLFSLLFMALFFVVIGHEWVRAAKTEHARALRSATALFLCIMVCTCQLIFSFYKDQYLGDITFNNTLVTSLRETILPAVHEIEHRDAAPILPSLSGTYLGSSIYQLPNLSEFSSFLGLGPVVWINPGTAATSTSLAFKEALKKDTRLRMWYLGEGEIQETCVAAPLGAAQKNTGAGTLPVEKEVNTERTHRLAFDITATDAPEKIFMYVSFKNEFERGGTRAQIRIDQYTKEMGGDSRRYVCAVNLYDIPAFALSTQVEDLNLMIETPGSYTVHALRLLTGDETLPSGTQ